MSRPALLLALLCATDAAAITRGEIMARAKAYADETWTCTAANTKASCTTGYTSDYGPGTYKGLPYDWGGYVELDQFHAQLAAGQGAGSHSWHGVLSCTTGVDCSGYVSKCWKGPHKSTSTMHTVAYEITKELLAPGDAWNDPGSHIVLWAGTAGNGAPLFYEASGSAKKVRYNTGASWSYLVGYKPVRYQYVEDDGAPIPGGKANPIVIASFPFHHDYSTQATGSSIYDTYSCMPQTGAEKGPEVFYRIDVGQPGHLEAHVSDGAGVDVDLHLLSALDPMACLARDDLDVGPIAVSPGTYWLIVDTWSNASGVSYPGAYALDVDFVATAPPLPPEDQEPPADPPADPADPPADPADPPDPPADPPADPPVDAPVDAEDAGPTPPAPVDAGARGGSLPGAPDGWGGAAPNGVPGAGDPEDGLSWGEPSPSAQGGGFAAPVGQPTGGPGQAALTSKPEEGCGATPGASGHAPWLVLALALLARSRRRAVQ
ncbi:MAG: hypothetical protein AMXMBFR64_24880 [Myxococcales bacterium]